MKASILFLLFTLVSCNDSLRSRATIPKHLTGNSEQLKSSSTFNRGLIIKTHKRGNTLSPVILNADDSLQRHEVSSEVIAVVLKIEGNKYYEYQEHYDYIAGKTSKKVLRKFVPSPDQYKDQTVFSDNTVRLTGYNKTTLEPASNVKVKFKQDLIRVVHLDDIVCKVDSETEESVVVLKDGKQVFTDFASSSEETSCDGILNSSEFSNLDLSSIQMCDLTSEMSACGQYNLNSLKK